MQNIKKVAVIGAGMAGLSAAHQLQKSGFDVTVFEKDTIVGGRIISKEKQGYKLDLGAITLSPAYRETLRLLEDTGGSGLLTTIKPVLAIARDGKLHELDLSNTLVSAFRSRFLSAQGKLAMLKILPTLLKYGSRCDFESMAQLKDLDTESCESFALRKLGKEAHDYLVDPVIRINMFSPTSVSSAVDLIWLIKTFSGANLIQVKGGMGKIASTVAANLNIRLCTTVDSVTRSEEGVKVATCNGIENFSGAIIAVPPEKALQISPWISGIQRNWFDKVCGVHCLTIHIGLKRKPASRAAMIMVPTTEAPDVLGIVLEHNKCPDRVPDGKGLMTLHMTQKWVETQQGKDEETTARNALICVAPFFGDLGNQIDMVNLQPWDHVDHERYVSVYKTLDQVIPLLRKGEITFAGEYISAGIEGAVISGKRCAENLVATLSG